MSNGSIKKVYTVCGSNADIPFSMKPVFLTADDAAKAIAKEVNARFKKHKMKQRVNIKSCYGGFMQLLPANIVWTYKVVEHDFPVNQ